MSPEQRRLRMLWPKVRSQLPSPPATVVELGCGRRGGFVPALRDNGYEALGIDPAAPEGSNYRQLEFERIDLASQVDGVVACTSLHHVGDPVEALDKISDALVPHGVVVVVEWDWERFDERTARWCFERLSQPDGDGWLGRHRDEWSESTQPWEDYLRGWATQHGIHSSARLLEGLDERFQRVKCERGPYFFPELERTTEADEVAAINAGQIQATRIDYVGRVD